jgi:hypothetical protein
MSPATTGHVGSVVSNLEARARISSAAKPDAQGGSRKLSGENNLDPALGSRLEKMLVRIEGKIDDLLVDAPGARADIQNLQVRIEGKIDDLLVDAPGAGAQTAGKAKEAERAAPEVINRPPEVVAPMTMSDNICV